MLRQIVFGIGLSSAVLVAAGQARAQFEVNTDRFGYAGTITEYSTLANAMAATNPTGSYTIAPKANSFTSTTEDLSINVNTDTNFPSTPPAPSVNILTAWYYTSTTTPGSGNPNNQSSGYVQLTTNTANSVSSASGVFTSPTTFSLNVAGGSSNAANYTNPQLGPVASPNLNGPPPFSNSTGTFLSYALHANFSGLSPEQGPFAGAVQATPGNPNGLGFFSSSGLGPGNLMAENSYNVTGTFSGIFQNTTGGNSGFYTFNFTLNNTSWAYDNINALCQTCQEFPASTFIAAVPEPASLVMASIGLSSVCLVTVWRRRRARAAA